MAGSMLGDLSTSEATEVTDSVVNEEPVTMDEDTVADAEPMEGKGTAEDTGEEPAVSEVKIEAEIKQVTEEKLKEEEEENNLPH
eukprot:7494803-Pyramimonas_sp.AAC.1